MLLMANRSADYTFPEQWNYPPYFTLQPVAETREKQNELWRSLLVGYCKAKRIFMIHIDDEKFEPFYNKRIGRTNED